MGQVLISEEYLQDTADAIREKAGTSDPIAPKDFGEKIIEIPGGGVNKYGTVTFQREGEQPETVDIDTLSEYLTLARYSSTYDISIKGETFSNKDVIGFSLTPQVTAIPSYFLYSADNLTTFSAPGVVRIGDYFGRGWVSYFETVNLPEVVYVGDYFFAGSAMNNRTPVSRISTPKLKYISKSFLKYSSIEQLDLPSLEYFDEDFLYGCTYFDSSFSIPTGMTTVPKNFLNGCTSFNKNVTIPNSILTIGLSFMSNCSSFSQILLLPHSITEIGGSFLSGCSAFGQQLQLPSSLTSIGTGFLANCTNFNQQIIIPSGVTTIGTNFLKGCSVFNQKVTIPGTVTSIGNGFMNDCNNFQAYVDFGDIAATVVGVNNYTFSTTNSSSVIYTNGFGIKSSHYSDFVSRFPNRTASPFRKLRQVQ